MPYQPLNGRSVFVDVDTHFDSAFGLLRHLVQFLSAAEVPEISCQILARLIAKTKVDILGNIESNTDLFLQLLRCESTREYDFVEVHDGTVEVVEVRLNQHRIYATIMANLQLLNLSFASSEPAR